jgi:hypothetical protein
MYPKMMEEYGIPYNNLVERLVELGLERFSETRDREFTFESGSDWFKK